MGQSHSRDPDDVCYVESLPELHEMFQSPSDIQEKLFPVLFWYNTRGSPESILKGLSQQIGATGKDSYISEEWLAKSLSRVCPGFDDIIAAAVPVLYNIILHHSTYPFKPLPNDTLTPVTTAIAVALLTANDTAIEVRERCDPDWPGRLHTRTRNWKERSRLLFQSLCDTDWTRASNTDSREIEDDEDLVAVIGSIVLHRRQRKVMPPVERYFQVAKTLPSSHSRQLDGRVSMADIKALLALIIVVSAVDLSHQSAGVKAAVGVTVTVLSSCFPDYSGRIAWEEFQQTTADCIPLLLTELAALLLNLFPIELDRGFLWYPSAYSWKIPPAIAGTDGQNKMSFLNMPQLSQLGLVIRRQELDELRLLRKGGPRSLSSSDISNLFHGSPEGHILLLVRGRVENNPLILVCTVRSLTDRPYTPPREQLDPKTPLSTPETDGDCIVQLLPTHRVLWSTLDCAQVKTITAELDDLLIDLGKVRMRFAKGLDTGMLETGLETVPFTVELIEVWGR